MDKVERFTKLRMRLEEAERKRTQAQALAAREMKSLKDRFGCETLEAAREKLAELEAELAEAKADLERAAADFEAKWAETLGRLADG